MINQIINKKNEIKNLIGENKENFKECGKTNEASDTLKNKKFDKEKRKVTINKNGIYKSYRGEYEDAN